MNNSNLFPNETDSDCLNHLESLDAIKEESVEIKEEQFDDMADFKDDDIIYYVRFEKHSNLQLLLPKISDYVKDEIEEIKEDFEDFADVKQEEPIRDVSEIT